MNLLCIFKELSFALWYEDFSGCIFKNPFLILKVTNFVKKAEHKEIRLNISTSFL